MISESSDTLNDAKGLISEKYKGVFVKNETQAEKYMSKHKVRFVIRNVEDATE